MARQGNSFALLGEDETDDLMTLLAHVASKSPAPVPAAEKKSPAVAEKKQSLLAPSKFPSKPPPPAESVRAERGRGRGGRGRGPGRVGSGGNDSGQYGNGRMTSLQTNFGGDSTDFQRNFGGDSDGKAADDGWRGRGRGGGRGRGRGRGRVVNEDHGFGNENQGFGGNENHGQGDDGWDKAVDNQGSIYGNDNRSFRNDNRPYGNENWNSSGSEVRSYGSENRGFRGGEGRNYGRRDGRAEGQNEFEKKEDISDGKEPTGNNDGASGWDTHEMTEVPKDVEPEKAKPEQADAQDASEKKVPEEEDKEMTLEEYEKLLSEKRKALEVLKTEERKVTLDKDFELMQLIEKKKGDNLFVKLKSEKDKLKKKDSFEKEEKVRKVVSINEFLKPAEGDKYAGPMTARGRGGRGRGRGERGGSRGGGFSARPPADSDSAPCIEDPGQFPLLGEQ